MAKTRSLFTSITPLPRGISRQTALDFLHNHEAMIDLNPLVTSRRALSPPPPHAPADERACAWYAVTDSISYLPGGLARGSVSYTCAFRDLPGGVQTHCYAPMGVDLRERWTVGGGSSSSGGSGGSGGPLPGEPPATEGGEPEQAELGVGAGAGAAAPSTGLYIREDVDLRCNVVMAAFVKRTIKKSHGALVKALADRARMAEAEAVQASRQRLVAAPPTLLPERLPSSSSWQAETVAEMLSPPPPPPPLSNAADPSYLRRRRVDQSGCYYMGGQQQQRQYHASYPSLVRELP